MRRQPRPERRSGGRARGRGRDMQAEGKMLDMGSPRPRPPLRSGSGSHRPCTTRTPQPPARSRPGASSSTRRCRRSRSGRRASTVLNRLPQHHAGRSGFQGHGQPGRPALDLPAPSAAAPARPHAQRNGVSCPDRLQAKLPAINSQLTSDSRIASRTGVGLSAPGVPLCPATDRTQPLGKLASSLRLAVGPLTACCGRIVG